MLERLMASSLGQPNALNWIPKCIPMIQSTTARPKDSAQIRQTLFLMRGWGLGTRLLAS